jgi:CubicO group peptidase (beta-lactamase class C family)
MPGEGVAPRRQGRWAVGELQRTSAVLEGGIADGTHIGAQLSVSLGGEVRDLAIGESRPGTAMTDDSMMIWFSMSKATCAVAIAQLWERGAIRLDVPACEYVPEFGAAGKDRVTLRHLLTHTAGFPWTDGILEGRVWREPVGDNRARIYAASLQDGWLPGERAGYHPTSAHTVLGAIVEAVDGRSYDRYVRAEIFEPLGMLDCWIGMPADRFDAYGDRIGVMQNTAGTGAQGLLGIDTREVAPMPIPGANGRGPMRELRRLYEMLLGEGARDGTRLLAPATVAAISARHRTGLVDETFGIELHWGLGLAVDTYITGRHSSRRAFGHGGAQSSAAFCDPDHGLAVAVVCNGMPGPDRHHPRMDAIASAIYEDLGLASGPGRSKPYPTTGL